MKRVSLCLALALALAGCSQTPPDQPAYFARMARFMGLVARCECSDITPARMIAEYPKALGGLYSEKEIAAMRGYIQLAASEQWDNEVLMCAEACSQTCMVNTVAAPLGGRTVPGVQACLVSERDLHLTEPFAGMSGGNGMQ